MASAADLPLLGSVVQAAQDTGAVGAKVVIPEYAFRGRILNGMQELLQVVVL